MKNYGSPYKFLPRSSPSKNLRSPHFLDLSNEVDEVEILPQSVGKINEYELLRLNNIRRNQEQLSLLGFTTQNKGAMKKKPHLNLLGVVHQTVSSI